MSDSANTDFNPYTPPSENPVAPVSTANASGLELRLQLRRRAERSPLLDGALGNSFQFYIASKFSQEIGASPFIIGVAGGLYCLGVAIWRSRQLSRMPTEEDLKAAIKEAEKHLSDEDTDKLDRLDRQHASKLKSKNFNMYCAAGVAAMDIAEDFMFDMKHQIAPGMQTALAFMCIGMVVYRSVQLGRMNKELMNSGEQNSR